jgi:2-iminobutanoate/2-iminopropanoate deaminase
MLNAARTAAVLLIVVVALPAASVAQSPAPAFEKKNYNYSEWTKGRFSEVVTVTGPGKMIFLAGIGSEDEKGTTGQILHPSDFMAQCRYAYDKIKRLLAHHGATLADVVKQTTYVTDIRFQREAGTCRTEQYGDMPRPAHTFLNVSALAWPNMLVEIDVIAMVK